MAEGDLITTDWEVELRGVLMGGDSVFVVRRFDPWSAPAVRANDEARSQVDGVMAGRDLHGSRRVPMDLYVDAATEAADLEARRALAAAWSLLDGDVPLVWQEGGVKYRLVGRPRLADQKTGPRIPTECRFEATDHRIFANEEQVVTTGFPTGGSGRTYSRTYDRVYGASGAGGNVSPFNGGTVATPWQATIIGPWVNPVITHVTTGFELELSITLAAAEVLVFDSRDRSIVLGGSASRRSAVRPGSVWFNLDAGANEVRFGGASGSGTAELRWRSAWI